jgi:3-methyladenine DNA glycosylase AlkD
MSRPEQLAAEIRAYCAAHTDPKQAGKWARYFREGYDAWGLLDRDHEFWTVRQQDWFARYGSMGTAGFLRLGEILFASGKYEEGAIAIRLLALLRDEMDEAAVSRLGAWFASGIGNWAHTDVLCDEVVAPLLESGRIARRALAPWRESKWKYQRRAVPVSLLGLVKAGAKIGPLLSFVRPLMTDAERVVQQGVGWFLREAWKKDPHTVEPFLLEWKDSAPRLIFQYATEKMTPAGKARFRASKRAAEIRKCC